MFEKNIWRCGAVDVNDGSGLARRGMIRDLFPSKGLIIDFGYPDHHAHLIPFSQCSILPSRGPFKAGDAVETLFRCSVNGPWCWYPSQLLSGSWDSYAFVEVSVDGKVIRQVVSGERVRPARQGLSGGDQEYYKHAVELSKTPWAEEKINNEQFLAMWNEVMGTAGARIEGGRLEYISLFAEPLTDAECCQPVSDLWFRSSSRGKKRSAPDEITSINAEQDKSTPVSAGPVHMADECINEHVVKEILCEIFCLLDVDSQVNCIKVCHHWNAVVHSASTSIRVEIDLAQCGSTKLATILHRMVTESTKVLILTCKSRQNALCSYPIRTVFDMLQAMHIKVPTIVMRRKHVWADDLLDFSGPVVKIRSEWGVVCRQLVLDRVAVYGLYEADAEKYTQYKLKNGDRDFSQYHQKGKGNVVFPVLKGIVSVEGEMGTEGLLDVLEKSIVNKENLDGLLESLLSATSGRLGTVQLLRRWQINDSRFHPDIHWTDIDFGAVKLQSLRPMTKQALTVAILRMHLVRRLRQGLVPAQLNQMPVV